jgi:hypothetical protein
MCGASRVISASASRARSPPESLPPRRRLWPGKAEPAQLRAHRPRRRALHLPRHVLKRGVAPIEFLDLILGEIADPHLAAGVHRAVHRRELGGKQARQRGLAVAVAAEQRDPVVGIDPQVEALQHRLFAIADRGQIERDQRRAQFVRGSGSRS